MRFAWFRQPSVLRYTARQVPFMNLLSQFERTPAGKVTIVTKGRCANSVGDYYSSRIAFRAQTEPSPSRRTQPSAMLCGVLDKSAELEPFDCREPRWCAVVLVVSRLNPVWFNGGDIPSNCWG